jgi:hypothetical protein
MKLKTLRDNLFQTFFISGRSTIHSNISKINSDLAQFMSFNLDLHFDAFRYKFITGKKYIHLLTAEQPQAGR